MITLLGFDYGPRKIGIAVGQTLLGTASPVTTLRAIKGRPDWAGIARLIDSWQPAELVVGLPLNMDDSETEVTAPARRFARQLEGRFGLPVHMVDERLTSIEAQRCLGPRLRQIEDLDAFAAKLILETRLSEHV